MNVSSLVDSIAADLKTHYKVSWSVCVLEDGEGDINLEISPQTDTIGSVVGYRLFLSYTRFAMELSVVNPPPIMTGVFRSLELNGKRNLAQICSFEKLLVDYGGYFTYTVNGKRYKNDSLEKAKDEKWASFSARFDSSFTNVHDRLDFHYQAFQQYVIAFAGYILLFSSYVDQIQSEELHEEGRSFQSTSVRYERNPINREICLRNKGYRCSVCGLDMNEKYGDIGKGFIEVHHAIPVSTYEEERLINPLEELFPVCPNCHAMLHRRKPPYSIEELKDLIARQEEKQEGR